jgi:hypothetical protein
MLIILFFHPVFLFTCYTAPINGRWDFTISYLAYPEKIFVGETFQLDVSIKNTGWEIGTVVVVVSISSEVDSSPTFVDEQKIYDIMFEQEKTVSFKWNSELSYPGVKYFTVDVYNPPKDHLFDSVKRRFSVVQTPTFYERIINQIVDNFVIVSISIISLTTSVLLPLYLNNKLHIKKWISHVKEKVRRKNRS